MLERELKIRRSLGEMVAITGLSLAPLAIAVLVIRAKIIANLLAYLFYLSFLATGYWVGSRWHKLIRLDNDSSLDPVDTPNASKRIDWFAIFTSVVVGFGVILLLRSLTTHEMARAFGNMMKTTSDD